MCRNLKTALLSGSARQQCGFTDAQLLQSQRQLTRLLTISRNWLAKLFPGRNQNTRLREVEGEKY